MLTFSEIQIQTKKHHLVVFLQDVVHLGHVFTGDGLDDVSFVVGSVKTSSAACLGVVRKGCTSGQGILPGQGKGEEGRELVRGVDF